MPTADSAPSSRALDLQTGFQQQLAALRQLTSALQPGALRQPCPGREKLGDGTVRSVLQHTIGNYERILAFAQTFAAGAASGDAQLLEAEHPHPDAPHHVAVDAGGLLRRLTAVQQQLKDVAALTDAQLDRVPLAGSFRFCDGQRTLDQVLTGLLRHQQHQQAAVSAALARD